MNRIRMLLRDDSGLAILLVALMGTVLLGMVGLAVDVGLAYLQDSRLQKAVDAAALAGAQELPADPPAAVGAAMRYAQANGLAEAEVTVTVEENNTALRVEAERGVRFFFAQALGETGTSVRAAAVARVGALAAARGVVPVGVEEQELQFGVEYVLKEGGGGSTGLGSGNYGILEIDKYPHWYEETLREGSSQVVRVGEVIPTATGVRSGDTRDGINARIAACANPLCSPDDFEEGCPRVMLVPVYRPLGSGNQVKEVLVVGFAAFWVEAVEGQGNRNDIRGYFVRAVVPGGGEAGLDGYGVYAARLSE